MNKVCLSVDKKIIHLYSRKSKIVQKKNNDFFYSWGKLTKILMQLYNKLSVRSFHKTMDEKWRKYFHENILVCDRKVLQRKRTMGGLRWGRLWKTVLVTNNNRHNFYIKQIFYQVKIRHQFMVKSRLEFSHFPPPNTQTHTYAHKGTRKHTHNHTYLARSINEYFRKKQRSNTTNFHVGKHEK